MKTQDDYLKEFSNLMSAAVNDLSEKDYETLLKAIEKAVKF